MVSLPTVRFRLLLLLLLPSPAATSVAVPAAAAAELPTENLMTAEKLGNFEDEGWEGYACSFADWATCVNSTTSCSEPASSCSNCVAKRGRDSRCLETMRGCLAGGSANPRECYQRANNCDHALGDAGCSKGQIDSFCTEGVPPEDTISCTQYDDWDSTIGIRRLEFKFPAGGVFPVLEQFHLPPNTAIIGAANPNAAADKTAQQLEISAHTWFVVPSNATLCRSDPMCKPASIKSPSGGPCVGDPRTHRQGFLMSSNTTLQDINFQGADRGRAGSEGTLCGPGAIELPGCLSGDGCKTWGREANGDGPAENVVIQNVRLSDAVKRADIRQMKGQTNAMKCNVGEALDDTGAHVHAHQVGVWVAKLPDSETKKHANVCML